MCMRFYSPSGVSAVPSFCAMPSNERQWGRADGFNNSSHQANMQITPTTICYELGKLPWRHWEKLLNHLVCRTWRPACSWKNKKIESIKKKKRYVHTFINGTHKLTTLAACQSVQDVTHLWPASCCIDGMAKKLFRDCAAADNKRRQKHRLETCIHISKECSHDNFVDWATSLQLYTDAHAVIEVLAHLWWGTHPGSQRCDPGQSTFPDICPLANGPEHGPGTLAPHHYFDPCRHFL